MNSLLESVIINQSTSINSSYIVINNKIRLLILKQHYFTKNIYSHFRNLIIYIYKFNNIIYIESTYYIHNI